MDTQNTRTHIKLWNRDFWLLAVANLLLSVGVYMELSAVAGKMSYSNSRGLSPLQCGSIIGIYGLGVFILGPYCHYLVQRYRRKHVCIWAIALMLALSVIADKITCGLQGYSLFLTALVGMFWYGAFFGLAQMVLSSTLVLDVTESEQRTEANYASAWFRRFAIAIGPLLAIILPASNVEEVRYLCYVAAILLLLMARVPFKTPDDDMHVFCTDRFFMSQGKWLTLNLVPITVVLGMSVAMAVHNDVFFIQLAIGFVIALIAERYAFANADLMSEFISGGFLIAAALLLYLTRGGMPIVENVAPCLIGIGTALIGSRILMFFIKLADHCQRGTSQSSFFLSWELGFAIGLFLTQWLGNYVLLDTIGLILVVFSLIFYRYFTHPWYMKHKSR